MAILTVGFSLRKSFLELFKHGACSFLLLFNRLFPYSEGKSKEIIKCSPLGCQNESPRIDESLIKLPKLLDIFSLFGSLMCLRNISYLKLECFLLLQLFHERSVGPEASHHLLVVASLDPAYNGLCLDRAKALSAIALRARGSKEVLASSGVEAGPCLEGIDNLGVKVSQRTFREAASEDRSQLPSLDVNELK